MMSNEDETILYVNPHNTNKTNINLFNSGQDSISSKGRKTTRHLETRDTGVDYASIERQLLSQYLSPIPRSGDDSRNSSIQAMQNAVSRDLLHSLQAEGVTEEEEGLTHLISDLEQQLESAQRATTHSSYQSPVRSVTGNNNTSGNGAGLSASDSRDNALLKTQKTDLGVIKKELRASIEAEDDSSPFHNTSSMEENSSIVNSSSSYHKSYYSDPESKLAILSEKYQHLESQIHALRAKLSDVISTEERNRAIAKHKLERIRRKKEKTDDWILSIVTNYEQEIERITERLKKLNPYSTQIFSLSEKLGVGEEEVEESIDQLSQVVNTAVPKMQQFIQDICQTIQNHSQDKTEITPKDVVVIIESLYNTKKVDQQSEEETNTVELSDNDPAVTHFMKLFELTGPDQVKPKMNALFMYTSQAKHYLQTITTILSYDSDVISDEDKVNNCKKLLSEWK